MTETENRDPFACPACGTVNVWHATTCRDCKESISKEMANALEDESATPGDDQPENAATAEGGVTGTETDEATDGGPHRRWNIFWIVFGIGIHVASIQLGQYAILKYWVEPDAELTAVVEKLMEADKSGAEDKQAIVENLGESAKAKVTTIQGLLIFLLAIVPILIGMLAGFFTGTISDGAASMGLSAVLILLFNGLPLVAVGWGLANAALGALGALLGVRLADRLRGTAPIHLPPPTA